MPVKKSGGGYKYGDSGKLYKGKSAKANAAKQGKIDGMEVIAAQRLDEALDAI